MWQLLLDLLRTNAALQLAVTLWTALSMAGLGTVMLFRKGPGSAPETMGGVLALSSFPASHCPGCNTDLGIVDRTPLLGWLVARGRCRHCAMPIPIRYPAIELAFLTPVIAAVVPALGTPWGLEPVALSLLYPFAYMAMRGIVSAVVVAIVITASALAAALLPGAPLSLAVMAIPFAAGAFIRPAHFRRAVAA